MLNFKKGYHPDMAMGWVDPHSEKIVAF